MQITCVKKRGAPARPAVLLALATLLATLALSLAGGGGFTEKAFAITSGGWEYEVDSTDQPTEVWITDYVGTEATAQLPTKIDGVPVTSVAIDAGHILKSLDCSGIETLKELNVGTGGLESLNVTDCAALETLTCANNKLTTLDISSCAALTYLNCGFNYLADIATLEAWVNDEHSGQVVPQYNAEGFAVEFQDKWAVIVGWDKRDTKVVLPDTIDGRYVIRAELAGCGIEELDISKCFDLDSLDCSYNYLKDISALEKWAEKGHSLYSAPQYHKSGFLYYIDENGPRGDGVYLMGYDFARTDKTIVVPGSIEGKPVVSIAVNGLKCEKLDLTQCTQLKVFMSNYGSLKSIDAHGLANLEDFYCEAGFVESLNISGCTNLQTLSCDENEITTLDLSSCTSLFQLSCNDNKLTVLDVSSCENLIELACAYNALPSETMNTLKANLVAKGHSATVSPQHDGAGYQMLETCWALNEYGDRGFVVGQSVETFFSELDPGFYGPWFSEDAEERVADSCWTIASSDTDVATLETQGNQITLTPVASGTTTITIKYAYEGDFGSYHAESSYEVVIAASANSVTAFSITPESVELNAIATCPICNSFHGGTCAVPYELQSQNPELPLSVFAIDSASDDPSTDLVTCVSQNGREYTGDLGLMAKKTGSNTATFYVESKEVTDSLTVTVSDISSTLGGITFASYESVTMLVNGTSDISGAFYLQDEADELFRNSGLSTYHETQDLIESVKSSDAEVIAVVEDANGQHLEAKKSGRATITLTDIFNNEVTCEIVVPTEYEIVCHFQSEDGGESYPQTSSWFVEGVAGDTTDVAAEAYEGFTAKQVTQKEIAADEKTVIDIYYDRNTYTVTWESNDGVFEGDQTSVQTSVLYGASLEVPGATKEGYLLAGWSPELPESMPAEDITLTAQWAAVADPDSNVAVSAPEPGGEKPALVEEAAQQAVAEANRVIQALGEGETPTGLDDEAANAVNGVLNAVSADPVSTLVVVKAEEVDANTRDAYLIEQELQKKGGSNEIAACLDLKVSLVVSKGAAIATVPLTEVDQALTFETYVNKATISGKNVKIAYVHWVNGAAEHGFIDPITVDYSTGKVVFAAKKYSTYAIVTSPKPAPPSGGGVAPAQKFQVTFESNGGSAVAAQEVESGATVTKPSDPTREGYTFAGWFSDEALTKAWDFAADKVTAKTTLYAKWTTQSVMFSDVDFNAWYGPAVTFVADSGLMRGYAGTDLFGVGKHLTRAELAVILNRHANPDGDAGYDDVMASTPNNTGMADVEAGVWYTGAANWAVANGVINGKENADGTRSFDPNGNVTFEEMVAMMVNLAATPEEIAAADMSVLDKFVDAASISDWSRASLAWAAQAGIFNGYDEADGTYIRPLEQITRERAAAVLYNNYA